MPTKLTEAEIEKIKEEERIRAEERAKYTPNRPETVKVKKQTSCITWGCLSFIIFIVIMMIIAGIASSCSNNNIKSTTIAQQASIIRLTADEFYTKFKANEISINTYEVSDCEVDDIQKGNIIAEIICKSNDKNTPRIECILKESEYAKLASINKGSNIAIQGAITGNPPYDSIVLNSCLIIKI